MDKKAFIEGLIIRAEYLNNLLLSAGGICLVVVIHKVQKLRAVDFKGVKIDLNYFWILAGVLTAVHYFLSDLFVNACAKIYEVEVTSKASLFALKCETWNALTFTKAPLLFQDMSPNNIIGGSKYFHPTGFANLLLVGILASMVFAFFVKSKPNSLFESIFNISFAILLCILNWEYGSAWIGKLSLLYPGP